MTNSNNRIILRLKLMFNHSQIFQLQIMSNQFSWAILVCLLALAFARPEQRQLYYLVDQDPKSKPKELTELEKNTQNIPILFINCKKQSNKCLKFKINENFPLLVLWSGPGTGFKILGIPTIQTFNSFMQKVQSHPIAPLRNFIDKLTFVQFMILSVFVKGLFYLLFSTLFKDRSGITSGEKKQKPQ